MSSLAPISTSLAAASLWLMLLTAPVLVPSGARGADEVPAPPAQASTDQVDVSIDKPYWGINFSGNGDGVRFFLTQVVVSNRTSREISIARDAIELSVNGAVLRLGELPAVVQNQTIRIGREGFRVQEMQTPERVDVPADKSRTEWVVFSGLPLDPDVPRLVLRVGIDGQLTEIDVNEVCLRKLKLTAERIGPRDSLGLLTVGGTLDTVNFGRIMQEIDRFAANGVSRIVLAFGETAEPFEPRLAGWLQQAATMVGREDMSSNNVFPEFPVTLREFHVAALPGPAADEEDTPPPTVAALLSSRQRVHSGTAAAVIAAMEEVYSALPREELLLQFETGHRLSRVAALAYGGGRLDAQHLPVLLGYADDKDSLVQSAALAALKNFGEPSAIDKLVFHATHSDEPARSAALESLAGSRYSAAHHELLALVKSQPVEFQERAVEIMGRLPRRLWSDAVYRFVTDPEPGPTATTLEALVQVGHPRVLEVLENALSHPRAEVQAAALRLLGQRRDRRSEKLASDYMLKRLQDTPPDSQMHELLRQTKDPRTVPALVAHFEAAQSDRSALIETLSLVGDLSVCEVFVKKYPELNAAEKSSVLAALQQLRSPQFYDLAESALLSDEQSLLRSAVQNLQADGSPEAVRRLGRVLTGSSSAATWSQACNALGVIATPQARDFLRKARGVEDETRRTHAVNALRFLQQRSPGFQFVYQGMQSFREEKWQQAATHYGLALQMDPELPDAYSGRGSARIELEQFEDAAKDFRKAYEIDPEDPQAITGLALALVLEGDFDEAFETMNTGKQKTAGPQAEMLYSYNSACIYARALERVHKQPESPERERKIAEFQARAIELLTTSVKKGFDDFDWMKKDPDLRSLHSLPEFQRVSTPGAVPPESAPE